MSPSTIFGRAISSPIAPIAVIVWTGWLILMFTNDLWHHFAESWFMSVTMVFGSFIAGATSEGGGAVAFPVMTLLFGIEPHIARDFSLIIQSVGMTAAALVIFFLRTRVEWNAVIWAGLGGAIGITIGLSVLAPIMPPAHTKIFFTSAWLSFAVGLFWINRQSGREVHDRIAGFVPRYAVLLFGTGIVGGMVSGLTGSGLDIVTFSVLVLGFRLTEKVATPTSVVLMGMNTVVGALWKSQAAGGLAPEAWSYWYVCVPVVVVGAPAGAWFIKYRSRMFIARFLYVSIIAQYTAAIIIIPMTTGLSLFSVAIFLSGVALFACMAVAGRRRLTRPRSPELVASPVT